MEKKNLKSFFESYNKCFTSENFFLLVKLYSISPVRLQHIVDKAFCSCIFLRSLLLTYLITLSLEKEITSIVLEKVWKNLEFWIQKSVKTLEREIIVTNVII